MITTYKNPLRNVTSIHYNFISAEEEKDWLTNQLDRLGGYVGLMIIHHLDERWVDENIIVWDNRRN